ncbi:MAG: hypothetical protein ACTSWP_10115 [Candidatus Freyarchaeota archaeon]
MVKLAHEGRKVFTSKKTMLNKEKKIVILVVPGFLTASKYASSTISELFFDAFFLNLPEELNETLRLFLKGEIDEDEVWQDYASLTESSEPVVHATRRWFSPMLNALRKRFKEKAFDLYCYEEAQKHKEANQLLEEQLYLEFKCKVTGKLFLDEWKHIIKKCLDANNKSSISRKIIVNVNDYSSVCILSRGRVRAFRQNLGGRKVKIKYMYHYWRPPLESLLILSSIYDIDKMPEEIFKDCIKQHLNYVEFILQAESLDSAHEKWVKSLSLRRKKLFRSKDKSDEEAYNFY